MESCLTLDLWLDKDPDASKTPAIITASCELEYAIAGVKNAKTPGINERDASLWDVLQEVG